MARCNLDALIKTISENKLTAQNEVTFTLHEDLPDCRKINTKNYVEKSANAAYNRYLRPANRFECLRSGCANSGTLTTSAASETILYHVAYDATEFAAGVLTFYVKPASTPAKITATIGTAKALSAADVYEITINEKDITDDGFAPVFIDLSKNPKSTEGGGWTASRGGAYLQLKSDKITGFSSISFFESIYDFEINDTVKVTCLSEVGGSFDIDALEATCLEAGYDDSVSSFDYTVTGNKVSSNYWKLNPILGKGGNTVGYFPNSVSKVVEKLDDTHGYVRLPDVYQEECGYFAVQIDDECNITDSDLKQLSIPVLADVDEVHYQIIRNEDGTTDIVVNSVLIGHSVTIAYPQKVDIIDEQVAHTDNLNTVRTRMTVPRTTSDGVRYLLLFDNVLITSFPATINKEETEFSFSISIQRNKDGVFFRRQRISTDNVLSPSADTGHI